MEMKEQIPGEWQRSMSPLGVVTSTKPALVYLTTWGSKANYYSSY